MKKLCFIGIVIVSVLFSACKVGVVSKNGGMDNQSYLRFVQGGSMPYDKVNVFVDNNPAFAATVDEPKKFRVKANTYVVQSGTRHVKVVHNGNTVYEKDVVVATQETKQIILP